MAANDPYLPDPVEVSDGETATFDGTEGETNTAIISGAMAEFDAIITIEAWDGTTWQEVTQLTDAEGDATFSGAWHTQFNRVYASEDARRLVIENVDSEDGWCAVEGDER